MFKKINAFTGLIPAALGIASVIFTIITANYSDPRMSGPIATIIGLLIIFGFILVCVPYFAYISGLASPKYKANKTLYFIGLFMHLLYYVPASIAPLYSIELIKRNRLDTTSNLAILAVICYVLSFIFFIIISYILSLYLRKNTNTKKSRKDKK